MRIQVIRKEEISCIIEHQEDEFYELDEVTDLCETLADGLSKPQCCMDCFTENEFKRGGCPCPTVMLSL
jgi:hypothetical protein